MAGEIKVKTSDGNETEVIHIRVPVSELAEFKAICETHYEMKYYKMIRKLIRAVNNQRLILRPTDVEKKYHNMIRNLITDFNSINKG